MPKKSPPKKSTVSDVKVSTSKSAPKKTAPKNESRKVNVETMPLTEDERLASLDVMEAETKSDGVITGLKPLTKYRFVEVDKDTNIEPINAAKLSGNKIRKGVLITKIVGGEDDED